MSNMKVLVTGANGLLGQHLIKQLFDKQVQVVATGRGASRLPFAPSPAWIYYPVDLTNALEVYSVMNKEKPDVVVHAAATTNLDECEKYPQQCEAINVHGTSQ